MARDLTLYWWGQTTSAFGSLFTSIALPVVAVVHLGATPGQVSLVSAASTVPALLLGLPAGVLADRIARPRRTLITLDALSALAVAAVAGGLAGRVVSVPWLVALALVQGAVSVVSEVVYFLHLNQLAETGGLGRARARLQAGQFGAGLVGRLLAGPTIVAFGPSTAMAVDAVSYLLSATALLAMRPAPRLERALRAEGGTGVRGALAGVRFLFGSDFYRALMILLVGPVFAGAGTSALTGPFLLRVVHVPTAVYGFAGSLSGVLGLLGSVVAGRLLGPGRDVRRVTVLAFTVGSACTLLLPAAQGPLVAALACAALGLGLPIFFGAIANVAIGPLLVEDVPEESMGRVSAALHVFVGAAGLLGALAGGALGDGIGIRPALWTLGLATLGAVLLALPLALRAGRTTPTRPDTQAPEPREGTAVGH